MTDEQIRQTDAYKAAYRAIDGYDFSYSDSFTNYSVLGDTWDEQEIISDIMEYTHVPAHVVFLALEDFKNKHPEYVQRAEEYVNNGCEALDDDYDY